MGRRSHEPSRVVVASFGGRNGGERAIADRLYQHEPGYWASMYKSKTCSDAAIKDRKDAANRVWVGLAASKGTARCVKKLMKGKAIVLPPVDRGRSWINLQVPPSMPKPYSSQPCLLCQVCCNLASFAYTKCALCPCVVHDTCRDSWVGASNRLQVKDPPDWVCSDCLEGRLCDLDYWRLLKRNALKGNGKDIAAGIITRFIRHCGVVEKEKKERQRAERDIAMRRRERSQEEPHAKEDHQGAEPGIEVKKRPDLTQVKSHAILQLDPDDSDHKRE